MTARTWLSAHIYFRGAMGSAVADRVIVDFVAPFIATAASQRWIDRAFFIRYADPASHIRLRLHGEPSVLHSHVKSRLATDIQRRLAAETNLIAARDRHQPNAPVAAPRDAVAWVAYEPEIERYAGPVGIRVAERLFCSSTRMCIDLLKESPTLEHADRLSFGLAALVALLGSCALSQDAASAIALRYRDQFSDSYAAGDGRGDWLPIIEARYNGGAAAIERQAATCWDAAKGIRKWPAPFDAYVRSATHEMKSLRRYCERGLLRRKGTRFGPWSRVLDSLVPSYAHMTSNRLGVFRLDECFVAHAVGKALSRYTPRA